MSGNMEEMNSKRLKGRYAIIEKLLKNGKKLRAFYRFASQNPQIELHDACQIILNRPNASVCYSFEDWDEMDRRITKDRKGIPYYDRDGNKRYVFDVRDTHGEERYLRDIYPMKRLLKGLDIINSSENADSERSS